MFDPNTINNIRENFSKKQESFTKEEMKINTNKDTLKGKMTGFLTSDYYKREKLFTNGFVFYALAFKEYHEVEGKEQPILPVWILHSSSKKIDENPVLLQRVKDNLDKLYEDEELQKKYRKLYLMFTDNVTEPHYFEIPKEFSPDFECYLSVVNYQVGQFPLFHLGYNLIIANQLVSKEVVFLPTRYWTEEYLKNY